MKKHLPSAGEKASGLHDQIIRLRPVHSSDPVIEHYNELRKRMSPRGFAELCRERRDIDDLVRRGIVRTDEGPVNEESQ